MNENKIVKAKRKVKEEKRCKKCGLSANDVPRPENFRLSEEGLCNICMMEKYQVILDGRSPLRQFIDEWAVGEPFDFPNEESEKTNKGD